MTMFDSYDTGVRVNCCDSNANYHILHETLPNKIYNIKNNFVGYAWNLADVFDWEISINTKILVPKDAIIYKEIDEMPTTCTVGNVGQKAYNTIDIKSWTCVGLIDGLYTWVEDKQLIYSINPQHSKTIELTPDMTGKSMSITFYDNKWNVVKTIENIDSNTFICRIGTSIKELNKNGLYYVITRIHNGSDVKIHSTDSITII